MVVIAAAVYFSRGREVTPIRTATAERQNLLSTISTNGKVEPMEDFQAHAPGPVLVEKLMVSLGQHVAANQELMRLDTADVQSKVAQAQASVAQSENSLQNLQKGGSQEELLSSSSDLKTAQQQAASAQASLNTMQSLQAKGSVSPAEVASARQRLNDANTRVAVLQSRSTSRYSSSDISSQKAQVTQSRAALAAAQKAYSDFDIRAPFSGTVYSLPVSQYDFVQAGEALLDVADLSRLQVRAYFDEPEIGKLAVGQTVKIVWDAKLNRVWHGHISQAPTTVITYGTRNVGECLITVDDPSDDLLPNTNVTVTVTTSERKDVLSVPREALHTEGTTNYVFRILNNRLVRTNVQVGVVNLTRVEITGGLNEHDVIALGATTQVDLADGARVKVQ
ncbi:efflux RND transporter periplasmic adaptor subunit [Granulicella cerasi]|uniref:Efflux RND transporter periplasmic adaptor subunit n=1 Tax=Granulicella cerasi TaxID=741063 RepID=A0ABW1Z4A6_9BACT